MGKVDYGHYIDIPVVEGEKSVRIAAGERIDRLFVLKNPSDGIPFDHIIMESDSVAELCFIVLPGSDFDISFVADLVGERANVKISGAYICGLDEKVSITTEIRHRVPSCLSYQIINGIAGGNSLVNFSGKIVVAPDSQKTEAYQTNHNVVLTPKAKVETEPCLEIYADDVKCSHGATIGALNEDERFYMRSRGIPEEEARFLQMLSFISPVLEGIPGGAEKEGIMREIAEAIRGVA